MSANSAAYQNDKPVDLSLIITCYNDSAILEDNVSKLISYLSCLNLSYELILVEDCSTDNTHEIVVKIEKQHADSGIRLKAIYHEVNRGRGAAVKSGLFAAVGKVVGFIDIDLEIPEWHIQPCVFPIMNGEYDVATGNRYYKVQPNFYILTRHMLTSGYKRFVRFFFNTSLVDTETGCKFFDRGKIIPIARVTQSERWFWDTEIMLLSERAGLRILTIPCTCVRNLKKESTVKFFSDTIYYFRELLKFRKRILKSLPLIHKS